MGFEGESCAISEVYAAVMTEILEGKSLEKAGATIVISRK
jgi:NifU-like protein involved in Fe-S cluster formation